MCIVLLYIDMCLYMYVNIYHPWSHHPELAVMTYWIYFLLLHYAHLFYFTILELYCIYRLTCFKKSCCKHCFASSKFSVNLCLMTIYYTIIWLHQFINFSTVVGYLDCFWCSIIINYPIISIYTHFFFFFVSVAIFFRCIPGSTIIRSKSRNIMKLQCSLQMPPDCFLEKLSNVYSPHSSLQLQRLIF